LEKKEDRDSGETSHLPWIVYFRQKNTQKKEFRKKMATWRDRDALLVRDEESDSSDSDYKSHKERPAPSASGAGAGDAPSAVQQQQQQQQQQPGEIGPEAPKRKSRTAAGASGASGASSSGGNNYGPKNSLCTLRQQTGQQQQQQQQGSASQKLVLVEQSKWLSSIVRDAKLQTGKSMQELIGFLFVIILDRFINIALNLWFPTSPSQQLLWYGVFLFCLALTFLMMRRVTLHLSNRSNLASHLT
jgi:FtsZ-interacting cell division protein ZipA